MKLNNGFAKNKVYQIAYFSSEDIITKNHPLLVINGGPGQDHKHLLFNSVWEEISNNQKVIFYDQRGTGSLKILNCEYDYSLEAYLLDVLSILKLKILK